MWCFLGKFAKRKSLKPDLFGRAATKRTSIGDDPSTENSPFTGATQQLSITLGAERQSEPRVAVVIPAPDDKADDSKGDDTQAQANSVDRKVNNTSKQLASSGAGLAAGAEAEGQNEAQPVEAPSAEMVGQPYTVDADAATKDTGAAQTEPLEVESVETSREPSIDDQDITVCLPGSEGVSVLTPIKANVAFDCTADYERKTIGEPSLGGQDPGSEISLSDSSLERRENYAPSTPQRSPQSSPHSSQSPSTQQGIVLDHEISPLEEATGKLEHAHLDPAKDGGSGSEDIAFPSPMQEKTDDPSENLDEVNSGRNADRKYVEESEAHVEREDATLDTEKLDKSLPSNPQDPIDGNGEEVDDAVKPEQSKQVAPTEISEATLTTESNEQSEGSSQDETKESKGPEQAINTSPSMKDNEAIAAMPIKTTRSGTRFSDDTNLLKDFLNRAQARKMTKGLDMPASQKPATSPRRSPRKALAELTSNSPSPQNPKDLANRPGTPPGKQRLDAYSLDAVNDVDELTAEPTSCRRSTRTRLPAPSKLAAGAPSFIPVRRADGADPVILQKSQTQDLAVQTRANTRRNKGQSKPPSVALKHLTAETVEMSSSRMHAQQNSKSVGWDDRLVYYQDYPDATNEEGKDEKRPKVRRLRGLGSANGTPAAKKVADTVISRGTPAPRRRGKIG